MGLDYVISNHETVAILIGIAIAIVVIAVFVQKKDKHIFIDGISFTEMKKPKIRP